LPIFLCIDTITGGHISDLIKYYFMGIFDMWKKNTSNEMGGSVPKLDKKKDPYADLAESMGEQVGEPPEVLGNRIEEFKPDPFDKASLN